MTPLSDQDIIRKLRELGDQIYRDLADVLELALSPDYGAERMLEEGRLSLTAEGKDPSKILPPSAEDAISSLRGVAIAIIERSEGRAK